MGNIKGILCGIFAVGFLLILFGCDTVRIEDYFPLEEGDTWTYGEPDATGMSAQQASGMTMMLTVTGTEMINGVEATKIESDDGSYELWTLDDEGLTLHKLYLVQGDGWEEHLFDPPLNVLPAEVTLGDQYPFETTLTVTTGQGQNGMRSGSPISPNIDFKLSGAYRVRPWLTNIETEAGNFNDTLGVTRITPEPFQLSVLEHSSERVRAYYSPNVGRTKLKGFDCGDLTIGPTYTYRISSGMVGGITYGPSTETTTTTSTPSSGPVIGVNMLRFDLRHRFGIDPVPQDFEEDLIIEEEGGGDLGVLVTSTKSWLFCDPRNGNLPLTVKLQFTGSGNFVPDQNGLFEDEDTITITDIEGNADPRLITVGLRIEF